MRRSPQSHNSFTSRRDRAQDHADSTVWTDPKPHAALEQAKSTIADHERTILSAEDREVILAALDTPAKPTDALRQTLTLHRDEGWM